MRSLPARGGNGVQFEVSSFTERAKSPWDLGSSFIARAKRVDKSKRSSVLAFKVSVEGFGLPVWVAFLTERS